MRALAVCLGVFLVVGCAQHYPGGVLATSKQAIAFATRECSDSNIYNGRWHARLRGDQWFLWQTGMQITVNARDAKSADGCVIVTR
jgi:hypothetical protein